MITVVVVTRNRAELLGECLASLAKQEADCDWSVLVVDNGSSDETNRVASGYAEADPRFAVMVEPEPGASRARNRAAETARTPFLLYVDDECTFPPGYISTALQVVENVDPVCFGGPIFPRHHAHASVPPWFKSDYGAFSLPQNNLPGIAPRLSAGNLGIAREALLAIGGFPESYGPVGSRMRYGEENAVIAEIWSRFGPARVVYEERLVNYHLVRPEKYDWPYVLRDSFFRGVARGRLRATGRGEDGQAIRGDVSRPTGSSRPRRLVEPVTDLILDITFLRLVTHPHRFSHWQNVVYERWMRYVAGAGFISGFVQGNFEGRSTT